MKQNVFLKPAVILMTILSDYFYSFAEILGKSACVFFFFFKCKGLLNGKTLEIALYKNKGIVFPQTWNENGSREGHMSCQVF